MSGAITPPQRLGAKPHWRRNWSGQQFARLQTPSQADFLFSYYFSLRILSPFSGHRVFGHLARQGSGLGRDCSSYAPKHVSGGGESVFT